MNENNQIINPNTQPFPKNTFVSLEGESRLDSSTIKKLCTFERDSFKQAINQLESYYSDDKQGAGISLGIKGDSGAGKTHLLGYLMQNAWKLEPKFEQVYLKAESSDFLNLYRCIIAQFDYQKIQEINTIWLSQIVQSEAEKYEFTKPIVDILKKQPNDVYKYLQNGLFSSSEIEHIQLQLVREITQDNDFVQAVSYLTDPLLRDDACDWFLGKNMSSNTLRKLGIRDAIDNVERAKVSLRFFVTLFARVHQPLLLYIDQIEYLLLDTSAELRSANIGALQSLAEIFSHENCFLCLSGITDAWNVLPEHFFTRIVSIEIPNLSLDEALNLVKTYLAPSEEFSSYTSEEDISPYTKASIREMLQLSDGNVARTLHLAYESFKKAAPNPTRIEVEQVKEAASSFSDSFVITTESPTASSTEIEKLSEGIQNFLTQIKLLLENRLSDSQKLEQQFSDYIQRMQNLNEEMKERDEYEREMRRRERDEYKRELSEGIQNFLTQIKLLLENRLSDSQKLEQQFSDYIQRMQNLNEEIKERDEYEREMRRRERDEYEREMRRYFPYEYERENYPVTICHAWY